MQISFRLRFSVIGFNRLSLRDFFERWHRQRQKQQRLGINRHLELAYNAG